MQLAPVVGDTPVLTGTVGTSTVGATGQAQIRRPDDTLATRGVTWTDDTTGEYSIATAAGDLNQAGDYYLRVKVTYAGGAVQTFAVDEHNREVMFTVLPAFT